VLPGRPSSNVSGERTDDLIHLSSRRSGPDGTVGGDILV
jgi:hypothetical protein